MGPRLSDPFDTGSKRPSTPVEPDDHRHDSARGCSLQEPVQRHPLQDCWKFHGFRLCVSKRMLLAPTPIAALIEGLLCLPTAPALLLGGSGDIGTSPIYEQLRTSDCLPMFVCGMS